MPSYELADFAPDTGHLHTCDRTTTGEECTSQCAEHLYVLTQDTDRHSLLTAAEHRAVATLGDLWGQLCSIVGDGPTRDADLAELIQPLHALQRAVLAQAAARTFPSQYRLLGSTIPVPHPDQHLLLGTPVTERP